MTIEKISVLRNNIWKSILFAFIILAIIIALIFFSNAYFNYKKDMANEELNKEFAELKSLTGEMLGQLTETRNQLAVEIKKRELAEKILIEDDKNATEKLDKYEKTKLAIVVNGSDASTDELCLRARRFNIDCIKK